MFRCTKREISKHKVVSLFKFPLTFNLEIGLSQNVGECQC